jgi:hypothetical protein
MTVLSVTKMKGERSESEQVKATMAEFAVAYERGRFDQMAVFLAPEAKLYLHDASGIQEIIGAEAASRRLEGLKGQSKARFGEAKIQFNAGGEAWVDAKLEKYVADIATENIPLAHSVQLGQVHSTHSSGTHALKAHILEARAGYSLRDREAHSEALGMISAQLERQGEQWRVKQMYYRSE